MRKYIPFSNRLLIFLFGLIFFFAGQLLLQLPADSIQIGGLGKTIIKLFQLLSMGGLGVSLLTLPASSSWSLKQVSTQLLKLLLAVGLLVLTAVSIGTVPYVETFANSLLTVVRPILPFLLGLGVLPLVPAYQVPRLKQWRLPVLLGLLLLMLVLSWWQASLTTMPWLFLFVPLLYRTFGQLLFQEPIQKRALWLISLSGLIMLVCVILFRQSFLPFHQESGLLFSQNFLMNFLATPLICSGIALILPLLVWTRHLPDTTSRLNNAFSAAQLTLTLLVAMPVASQMIARMTRYYFETNGRFLLLLTKLLLVCLGFVLLFFFFSLAIDRFLLDIEERTLSTTTIILLGFFLVLAANLWLLLCLNDFRLVDVAKWQGRSFFLLQLNLLLLSTIYLLSLMLFNRFWYGNIFFLVLAILYGFANYQKLLYRDEPLLPSDLSNYAALPEVVQMIGTVMVVLILLSFVVLIGFAIWLQRKSTRKAIVPLPIRVGLLICLIFLLVNVGQATSNFKYGDKENWLTDTLHVANFVPHPESLAYNARLNGQLLAFSSLTNLQAMITLDDYNQKSIQSLEQKYQKLASQLNKDRKTAPEKQTVVYILSESFSDPSRLPTVELKPDPIPYTRQLMQETTAGEMLSMGYGGGTANIEFEALTSLSMYNFNPAMTTPYLFVVPKREQLFSINQLFEKSIAIHPYTASTYRRDAAFEKLGFDEFYYRDNEEFPIKHQEKLDKSRYISDEAAFTETLDHIKQNDQNLFIQLTTMQNHMPYDKGTFNNTIEVAGDLTGRSKQQVATFSQGIHYSDEAMKQFIQQIDQLDQPVTLVFYGDHLPSIYKGDILNQPNIEVDLHLTDYFIYSNQSAKNVSRQVTTPNMFTPLMLAATQQKVSPYYALMTEVAEKLPAMELQMIVDNKGKLLKENELSKEQLALLHDYQLIQYDITTGKDYLTEKFFEVK
ncbi:hypothetical protein RU97_GL002638 [Enterococcus canis]|uniref:Sulfatase N-terminal domain-containing protein n=1 Tax=Enterococcus canis TaxID=214095 RepID=A0A1L8RCK7_9ENTE|nr:alkaline phosphatase family protein [Enterococcus canis]OJG17467.1 hypothetical protein RU97_GL002638 [Enterococcus canis]